MPRNHPGQVGGQTVTADQDLHPFPVGAFQIRKDLVMAPLFMFGAGWEP